MRESWSNIKHCPLLFFFDESNRCYRSLAQDSFIPPGCDDDDQNEESSRSSHGNGKCLRGVVARKKTNVYTCIYMYMYIYYIYYIVDFLIGFCTGALAAKGIQQPIFTWDHLETATINLKVLNVTAGHLNCISRKDCNNWHSIVLRGTYLPKLRNT